MIRLLLPVILLIIGGSAGVGAGLFLRPPPPPAEVMEEDSEKSGDEKEATDTKDKEAEPEEKKDEEEGPQDREYVKLNNQFVIPVVENGAIASLVVMSLSVEVEAGSREVIYSREPKLRDSFLQVLFDHANIGGFRGAFTDNNRLDVLRTALREVASRDAGEAVTDVLILEIARQDY